MAHMLILGAGYTGAHLADRLRGEGWRVSAVRREAGEGAPAFSDAAGVSALIGQASHILSSVPPAKGCAVDPVIDLYGDALAAAPARWIGYLSSTGVYGDTGGAWVDEGAAIGGGRRSERSMADAHWQGLRADMRVFRLPGIYGPGRSAIERVRAGLAHRIELPGQVFSRVHVDDIIAGILASMDGPPGVYNLADDYPCSQNAVIEEACDLLGLPWPAVQSIAQAGLSPMAAGFYAENRRVANGKAKRLLGWAPLYPTYREGLRACLTK